MNQILSVEMPNKTSKKKSSIKSILVVFAIFLMVFGIGLTGTGAYSYYRNLSNNLNNGIAVASSTKPVITTERESSSVINIVVTHDKEIANITYTINDGEAIQIDGGNKTNVKERVELPVGNSNINITAKDINGITASYQSSYQVQQKPEIKLEPKNQKVSVKVTSKINLETVMCYWDEDKENAQNFTVQDTNFEKEIDIIEGQHEFHIVATDSEGNEETKTQKIKGIVGATKPKIVFAANQSKTKVQIKLSDDEELTKLEYTLNSNETQKVEINEKEYKQIVELEDGENKLTVTVYNKKGLSETQELEITK